MQPYYLYKITNKVNGKFYIGVTKDVDRRWTVHCSKGSKCPKLKAAISKYGRDSFTKEILCVGEKDYIIELEAKYIAVTDNIEFGYNIHKGGKYYPSEHKIPQNEHLQPIYVMGFWFPCREKALSTLNLPISTFYRWVRNGTVGDVVHKQGGKEGRGQPVYIKGFWLPNLQSACEILNISRGQAYRLSKINPSDTKDDFRTGSQKGEKSPSRIPVFAEGEWFPAIHTASEVLGICRRTIKRRILNNVDGYSYAQEE